jgi:ubiquinone/menaquinone biosynthesis C-methylase UbiE
MLAKLFITLCRIPYLQKKLWHGWYQYLARHYRGADWTFMNYGFNDPASRLKLDPADKPDQACIQLYNHVAGAVSLEGLNVLEVGSGRGGGASYIARYLKPAALTGVDLSEEAIGFCRRTHRVPGLSFQTGDAESLPFESDMFDVVVNIESSHCYPHLPAFFHEVARVLKHGGHFLYADFRSREEVDSWRHTLMASGLTMQAETDITPGVIRGLDADNDRKRAIIERAVPKILHSSIRDFAALRGSKMYNAFLSGSLAYHSFVLQKL